ncbi:MAG: efflux RND transporter periplasmic adaptor subunit [Myxococcales bacterium]
MKPHAVLSALLFAAGCENAQAQAPLAAEPPAIQVTTAEVTSKPMPSELTLAGQLVANQQSEVAANGIGRVVRTFVDRGTFVKAGAALIELDTRSAQLEAAEARANLETAQVSRDLAQTLCKRTDELFARSAISKEEWERTSSQCRTSVASVTAARARADLAAKTLSDAIVRAPFSGLIGEREVSVGEYVLPATRVATLVELDPLRLQLTVPEADVGQLHEGQEVRFTVEAFPGRTFEGTVKYLDPSVRSATRDLIAEAVVANAEHLLKPGMFATAHLVLPDQNRPVVPKSALAEEGNSTHLFVVVAGHLEERIVQPGPERDGSVAILDGVHSGERVAAALSDDIRDGVPVR